MCLMLMRIKQKARNDMSEKLKPCPFCGSKWTQVRYSNNPFDKNRYRAECTDCYAVTKACNNEQDAIEAWNRRAESEEK